MDGRRRIELKGTAYQIGKTHGEELAEQIRRQLGIYREMFQETCKMDWQQVRSVAEEFKETMGKIVPELLMEIQGIADGLHDDDIDVLDIVALNARSEIALGKWNDGCTALAWTLQGHPSDKKKQILAQNWDWKTSVGENLAMVSIEQEGKPRIWMVTEAGIVGKIGFNSASVGVCLNAIRARPISTSLLPIHLLLRICLECESVDSAIETIERFGGAASSQHILIADANGSRGLELSPLGGVYLKPDSGGVLVHTNHFLANKLVEEPPWLSGSPFRLQRAHTLCKALTERVHSNAAMHRDDAISELLRREVFNDRENTPQAICCSPDPNQGPLARIQTLFNIVMIFQRGQAPRVEVIFAEPGASPGTAKVFTLPW